MRYLHIAYDSPFFDKFIAKIPASEMKDHVFAVIGKNLKHIRSTVRNFERLNEDFWKYVGDVARYDGIYLHFLGKASIKFVNKVKHPGIVWVFWGADGYKLPRIDSQLYLPETRAYVEQYESERKGSLVSMLRQWVDNRVFAISSARALRRIRYCATWVKEDFLLARDAYNKRLKWIDFSYLNEEELFLAEARSFASHGAKTGRSVMVGNSANPTNNHLDIFDYLKKNNVCDENTTVYCPLSYSGKQAYIDTVVARGKALFGDRFVPLTDFMAYNDYLKLLAGIDIFFFFHRRQQAVNNSLSAKWLGKTIVLHPDNNLYKTFNRWGIHVLSANDAFVYTSAPDAALVSRERKILSGRFSAAQIVRDYENFFGRVATEI